MKPVRFSEEKNAWLKVNRGIDFEEISKSIKKGKIVKVINHPNKKRYPKQRMFLVNSRNYIFIVPFIEESEYIFLKTIYPSRKYTKQYLKVRRILK
ncbi:toxin [Candidatus Roizmanbacteria bacterium RIFCSPLOWO2_01_FULL_37_12]|uniref:Toxin n=1 Tax=Candidatus Roizmanbacteria bacterium RIFCSPLOWO2_01_FULL_37_12 TaxID=1802056 RepID=A0A1F7IEX3_9BACT|nr:MAG: toxin [Candidatus Roizmanbacteria bacterium RIFCSPHIGHO2_02_FULL_37_9b]OGK41884.1 MAG: toxin [Candidatus Roizmanbacteria bacterium RIFCSPLOWO2_01_FULL_37_12]